MLSDCFLVLSDRSASSSGGQVLRSLAPGSWYQRWRTPAALLQLATLYKPTCPSSSPLVLQAAGAMLSRATSFDSGHWGSPKPLTGVLGNNGHPLPGLLMAKQVGGGGLTAAAAAHVPEGPQHYSSPCSAFVRCAAAQPKLPSIALPGCRAALLERACSLFLSSPSRPDSFQLPLAFPDAGRQPGPGACRGGRGQVGGSTGALAAAAVGRW